MTDRPNTWTTFPAVLEQIIKGELPPPNLEPMTDAEALYNIATYHFRYQRGLMKTQGGRKNWATYFTSGTQGGQYDGGGFVLYYSSGDASNAFVATGKAAKFTMCQHVKTEEGHSPNHSRGWHPGHCINCGLDLSVDSGD